MSLNFLQWRSLKTRVTLLMLGIFLTSIWLQAFYATRVLREDMQRLLGEQQLSTVAYLATEIDDQLKNRINALELIARAIDTSLFKDPVGLQIFLERLFVLHSLFNAGVTAHRLDGAAIVDVPLTNGRAGVNYMEVDSVAAALTDGKSTVGRPVVGEKLAAPVFAIAVPVRDARGKVIGALTGFTNLGQPNFLDKITDSRYGKTGGYLINNPRYREVITATDKSRIMSALPAPGVSPAIDRFIEGHEDYEIFINPRGVEVLASARGIPAAGWYVAAQLPTDEAFAPIRAMQQRMLLATIVLTLLTGGLTWWLVRRQLSPMVAAARMLASLAATGQPLSPLPIGSQDEIGQLIGGFNQLLETLGQHEKALRSSEQHFRAFFERSTVGMAATSPEKGWIEVNDRLCEMLGYSRAELTGMTWAEITHPDDLAVQQEKFNRVLSGEADEYEMEKRFIHRAGHAVYASLAARCIRREDGTIDYFIVLIDDITDRKRLQAAQEEALDRLQKIASRVPGVVFQFRLRADRSSCVPYASDALHELYRIDPAAVHDDASPIFAVVHPDDLAGHLDSIATSAKDLSAWHNEYRLKFAGEADLWLLGNALPQREADGSVLWHGFITDITQRKQTETELLRSNSELEQFSYSISHDMRQPLRMIASYLQLLERSLADQLDGEKREYFNFAIDGAKRMDTMMLGLLEYSRVGRKCEPAAPVATRGILDEALRFLQPAMAEAQAEVRIEGDWPTVLANPDEILRLLQNLIGNALKFRIAGRTPQIIVSSASDDNRWRVSVADNGLGIAPEQISRLFQVFQRLQSRAHYEGTGIGLALCRKIVEHHGGRIWVESAGEGLGTRFIFELPLNSGPSPAGDIDRAHPRASGELLETR